VGVIPVVEKESVTRHEDEIETSTQLVAAAVDLAEFVKALRKVDPSLAPQRQRGERGGPLAESDQQVRRSIEALGTRIDAAAALESWEESLVAEPWTGDEVWVHGDLLAGNLLTTDGRLSAVIDWGGLNVGDPACDLMPARNIFAGEHDPTGVLRPRASSR